MCDLQDGFKLCTCSPESLKELTIFRGIPIDRIQFPDFQPTYIWTLKSIDPNPGPSLRGRSVLPKLNVGDVANIEFVEQEMNARNCFDFEYQPDEGDYISFQQVQDPTKYFAFRFTAQKWKRIDPDPFGNGLIKQKKGIVDYDKKPDAFK